jgi:bacillithiol biosynthesis cysteine-adding enzyme BshC
MSDAFDASGKAARRLEAAATSGFVVTTGQQPGLFGGPLYNWWKAIGVLALADALQQLTGRPVAPVFWAATDDSDFVEAATTYVLDGDTPVPLSLAPSDVEGVPMSEVPVGDVTSQLSALQRAAGSAANQSLLDSVITAYSGVKTVGGAYVEFMRNVLADVGVSVLDASHPSVRESAHPVLVSALERGAQIQQSLLERDTEIKTSGHHPQVQTVKGRTLVFRSAGGRKDRVPIARGSQVAASATAGELSPNVILRPIIERAILPTVAYLGGPAEVAYFAQVSAVATALEIDAPLVLPRWSAAVIEPRIERILERYGFTVEDFADPHAIETKTAKNSLPPAVGASLDALRAEVSARLSSLSAVEGAELIPKAAIDGAARNVAHRLARLERRFTAAIKRRGNDALRDIAVARASLFPLGKRQERVLNGVPFLARYGDELWNEALAQASRHVTSLI